MTNTCIENQLAGTCEENYSIECVEVFSDWSNWGPCEPDCIEGKRMRIRTCTDKKGLSLTLEHKITLI